MIPPTFHIGDEVLITGPTITGCKLHTCPCGRKAEIDPNWPKLDEELKIGDWVEVISEGYVKGKILQIKALKDSCGQVLAGNIYFGPDSLRKLTPDEIKQHIAPKLELSQEAKEKIRDLVSDAITGKSRVGINERLSAIEKQLKEQREKISQFDGEIGHLMGSIQECLMESGDVEARTQCREMAIEKRLAFVEKFQRDQTRDALYKGWRAGP